MWRLFSYLLVAVLVCAATAKVVNAQELLRGGGLLSSRWLISGAVGYDLAVAALICSCPPAVAHRIALVAFSLLGSVAGFAWFFGSECNCFGPQAASGLPLLVDIVCVLGLCLTARSANRPAGAAIASSGGTDGLTKVTQPERLAMVRRPLCVAVPVVLVGAVIAWGVTGPGRPDEVPVWFGETLVGQLFPLLQYAEIKQMSPARERRIFVFLRPDCSHCRELAQRWQDKPPSGLGAKEVVGVTVSPSAWRFTPGVVAAESNGETNHFVLHWESREPFVAAPTIVAIYDQIVVAVKSGDGAAGLLQESDWVDSLFAGDSVKFPAGP